jgi:plastocyanin
MQFYRFIIGSALLILTSCQHALVRDSLPSVTRTGEVKDVVIQEDISPATLIAHPGDEIRWVNKRHVDVNVMFFTPVMELLTCQRNFQRMREADRNQYMATVETNDTASACFRRPTELKYVVSTKSSEANRAQNLSGTITISPGD